MVGRLILCGVIMFLAAAPRVAAPFDYGDFRNELVHPSRSDNGRGEGISLDEAVSRARRQTDGKILSAETVRKNGRRVHRIKVLTPDGRVRRVQIDAGSGGR